MAQTIKIEIAYAAAKNTCLIPLDVTQPCTIYEAIQQSGILTAFPEINLSSNKVGVFSVLASLDSEAKSGDRIEIYRPLLIDPKQARKQRAKS